jgi:vesicle-associated membrane protein 72
MLPVPYGNSHDGLQAQDFRQQGTQVRRKMWLQNMKIKLIVLGIIIALILIIILSVCHGFKCNK